MEIDSAPASYCATAGLYVQEEPMNVPNHDEIRGEVRKVYAKAAGGGGGCCAPGCCTPGAEASRQLGYSAKEQAAVPEGADLGLGCGNPQGIASLAAGETVLDLGSGAGFDCFLAAMQVGPTGRVIGVDMTPEMVAKARSNAERAEVANVEFRLGEIEHLPARDGEADVVISNCVINLVPDKAAAYREAFRALRPGGRLAIADVVATQPIPARVREDLALHSGCIAGAATVEEVRAMLIDAGFAEARVEPKEESLSYIRDWAPGSGAERFIVSAYVTARKGA
jgi:arsenite methyltransferase